MLGAWPDTVMAGDQLFPEFGGNKSHRLPHDSDPLLVYSRLLSGPQPHIETAWGPVLRAHGHGHEHQAPDFFRVVQAVLQGDTGPQCIPDQHQVAGMTLRPQPAPYPFGIALDVRTGQASAMAGQGRGETAAKMVKLVAK